VPDEYTQEYVERGADRIGVQVYPLPVDAGAPMVVLWPAMGVPARYYRPFARQLQTAGLGVAVADLRGTGVSTPAPSPRARYRYADLADDVGAVLDHLGSRLDGRRVVLFGHSLGGQVSALHLARRISARRTSARSTSARCTSARSTNARTAGAQVDGLALVAVGVPWFRAYRAPRSVGILAFSQWMNVATALMRFWPGWGFGGPQAAGVIRDWAYTVRHGRFPAAVAADGLDEVRVPVLAVSLAGDALTPSATLDRLCALMPNATIDRRHLRRAELGVPVDHLSWARTSTPIAQLVADWAADLPVAAGR
jgi:predicted alpha/beta hydrolase